MRLLVAAVAAAGLLPAVPAFPQAERTEFATLAKATCTLLPACAIPKRGSISCPGGGDALLSLMPPWCEPGTRTQVRDRMLVYSIVETTDPRVTGTVTFRLNMNLDSSTFSGPLWGTYALEVPDRGRWQGHWEGTAQSGIYWTYKLVLHGSGEFEGMHIRARGTWQAGQGDRLEGVIVDPGAE